MLNILFGINRSFALLPCFSLWGKHDGHSGFVTRNITCDILIGWSCWVMGSMEPIVVLVLTLTSVCILLESRCLKWWKTQRASWDPSTTWNHLTTTASSLWQFKVTCCSAGRGIPASRNGTSPSRLCNRWLSGLLITDCCGCPCTFVFKFRHLWLTLTDLLHTAC